MAHPPRHVYLFEISSRVLLWIIYPLLWYVLARGAENTGAGKLEFYVTLLICIIFYAFWHYLILRLTYQITRKRSKFFYLLTLFLWVLTLGFGIYDANASIDEFGMLFFLATILFNAWQAYLLVSDQFRNWIYGVSEIGQLTD